ncbi:MAG: DUF1702 family protein [Phycisphaerae bacterium]
MNYWVYIALAALVAVVLIGTGFWRLAFAAFAIPSDRMTVDRLGLLVESPEDVERVNTILQSFAGGFNAMIAAPAASVWQHYCDSLPVLCRPFAHEGAAMGFTLRNLFQYDPTEFEDRIVKPRPGFRYLYYVGLGFWSGMRNHDARRLSHIIDGLDPLHSFLCYDGYGFKHAFFDYPKNPESLRRLDALDGYARNGAYQGVGRAFFFLFMARPEVLVEHISKLGDYAMDTAAGAGLASVFVFPDRLEVAQELGNKLPQEWHDHFHLGMCFGLKARSINDVDQFERDMARADTATRDAVYASIRECDRVELQVRSEQREDGYRRWRERVTEWMADHIKYPMAGALREPRASARADSPDALREPQALACADSPEAGAG